MQHGDFLLPELAPRPVPDAEFPVRRGGGLTGRCSGVPMHPGSVVAVRVTDGGPALRESAGSKAWAKSLSGDPAAEQPEASSFVRGAFDADVLILWWRTNMH